MSENRLMFWQRMARHYTTVMGRSAPLYREVCSRIRPHLNRDMNVLELACGTGQLSFPLSPYVRLWEATDFSSNMIAEAKRQVASSRLHFSVQDAADLPYAPETFDAVVIANALHILQEPDKVMAENLRPRRREAGRFSYLVYGADWLSCLPSLERRGICILSVPAGFLGGGTCVAGESHSAPVLCCLPMGSAGVSLRAECVVTAQG